MTKIAELDFARFIARVVGYQAAARYMRNRGWSLEAALFNLLGR